MNAWSNIPACDCMGEQLYEAEGCMGVRVYDCMAVWVLCGRMGAWLTIPQRVVYSVQCIVYSVWCIVYERVVI